MPRQLQKSNTIYQLNVKGDFVEYLEGRVVCPLINTVHVPHQD